MNDTIQKTAFLEHGEADAWFSRNRAQLDAPSTLRSEVVRCIARNLPQGKSRVLEIGCGQGTNLIELGQQASIEAYGIEPSSMAVELSRRHPQLDVRCGTADVLPWADEYLDVVWFGFCLYLVDRSLLFRSIAEADRVLKNGGLIAILDFDPDIPCQRQYHHRPGLWSYKMNYAGLFLANPAYRLVEKISLSHAGPQWTPQPQERLSLAILCKDAEHAYRVDD